MVALSGGDFRRQMSDTLSVYLNLCLLAGLRRVELVPVSWSAKFPWRDVKRLRRHCCRQRWHRLVEDVQSFQHHQQHQHQRRQWRWNSAPAVVATSSTVIFSTPSMLTGTLAVCAAPSAGRHSPISAPLASHAPVSSSVNQTTYGQSRLHASLCSSSNY